MKPYELPKGNVALSFIGGQISGFKNNGECTV